VKTIDLESHFLTPTWQNALATNTGFPRVDEVRGLGFADDAWMPLTRTHDKLTDLGEYRLGLMDDAGVDYAVLSLTSPGAEQFPTEVGREVARDANDYLAAAIKKYPDRLGGFASLAPKDAEWSAQELERCVKELGFKAWNTHSNFGDSYLDEKRYWPILAKAEELDIPIYLHPAVPMIKELREFGMVLGGPTLGFGTDVTYCFMRMIVRGVFDEYPNLKIIMGHLGEALPFLVDRVNRAWMQGHENPNPEIGAGSKEPAGYYLMRNLWVTTSGNYLPAALVCTRDSIGMDKILLGTDFPYEDMKDCMDYLRSLPLTEDEAYALFEGNARALGF
jgi:uncharacterized protein